jgi:hypothetical protein
MSAGLATGGVARVSRAILVKSQGEKPIATTIATTKPRSKGEGGVSAAVGTNLGFMSDSGEGLCTLTYLLNSFWLPGSVPVNKAQTIGQAPISLTPTWCSSQCSSSF